jgi:hypothetical protein
VGPRSGLDDVKRGNIFSLPVLEVRPLGRPARSPSLYRLRYPVSNKKTCVTVNRYGHMDTQA